ncbi:hypothetical protein [Sphingobacterium mizutaii]|uniref:hypothetical protein n=1 Tax=Sphingobacterium mizutaii TaxID=1010 RepID=UPI0016253FEE|nr:hypothetical protein [Sphingobacterium mizutaii]
MKFIKTNFLGLLIILMISACSKNKIAPDVEYVLDKYRTQEYLNGKLVREVWDKDYPNAKIQWKADGSIKLTYFVEESKREEIYYGTRDEVKKTILITGETIPYYFEGNYLVLVLEDYLEDGTGDISTAFFKKVK